LDREATIRTENRTRKEGVVQARVKKAVNLDHFLYWGNSGGEVGLRCAVEERKQGARGIPVLGARCAQRTARREEEDRLSRG